MSEGEGKTREETSLRDALDLFDRLEKELRAQGLAPIESCLAKVAEADRPAVLCLLVGSELAVRWGRGESPRVSDYLKRFPDHEAIVRAAFARSAPAAQSTRVCDDDKRSAATASPRIPTTVDKAQQVPQSRSGSTDLSGGVVPGSWGFLTDSAEQNGEATARYSLSRFHKAGGLGEVWRAHDVQLGREVALKRLKEECVSQSTIRARFLREAWITGQLQHPGIVPVFELGTLPDCNEPFYTMRFIEGPTLSAAVAEFHRKRKAHNTGPLDLRRLLGSFVSACQVVAYAHSRGVIHRDLKGDNIVLGDFGEVVVLDWGIAKVMGGGAAETEEAACQSPKMVALPPNGAWDETIDGSVLGTPAYMPPEQALGRIDELDERSDVYGMGAILYEILTGEPPFRGKTEEVLQRVVSDPPEQPRLKVHDAPEALEAICLKCLAKRPADRYPCASALADDIQRFLAGEPVSVHRERWSVKMRRWASRHRTLVTATLATLLVATGCLAVATALLRISNRREATARGEAEKNLSLTLHAVDSFFTRVADAPSLKLFGLEKFQKEVLTEAEKVIKQLLDAQTGAAAVSVDHARCCLRLSLITEMLGEPQAAIPYALEARSIFAKLAESENDPRRRAEQKRGLAESLGALGLACEGVYRLPEAEASHEQAAKVWESLASDRHAPSEFAYRLAASLNRRGRLPCLKLGDPRGARDVLALALQRCDQLVAEHPDRADYTRERARARVLTGVAMSFSSVDNIDRATALFDEALLELEKLAGLAPNNTEVQADLVDACALIAASYSNARLEGRIKTTSEQVRRIAKRVAREHPDVPVFAENHALIEALHAMRIALHGNYVIAVQLLDEGLKSAGNSGLARMFAACGLSVASDVASRDPALKDPERAILIERYQARAVELLREAKKTGLFFQPHQLEGVRSSDADLNPLRNRADFRKFLSELEAEVDRGPGAGSAISRSKVQP